MRKINVIRSHKHQIYIETVNKVTKIQMNIFIMKQNRSLCNAIREI